MKWILLSALFFILIISFIVLTHNKKRSTATFRYVALGDSYTIGEGASKRESWPTLLTNHLQNEGVSIDLVANPSVTGWTTQQVIDEELSVYDSANPNFATLLIGVNDWVQGVSEVDFHKNLIIILDRMQAKLPNKHNLILVTIPDFSVTPTGKEYANGRDISKGIDGFNKIIKLEAKKRGLSVVDIYPITQQMKDDLTAPDGLHPSAKEYALWEKLIYPVAENILKNNLQ